MEVATIVGGVIAIRAGAQRIEVRLASGTGLPNVEMVGDVLFDGGGGSPD